jgi:Ca2+-binding RTX toxin-like protein
MTDTLVGSAANARTGGAGADKLYGLAGNDRFYAQDGVRDTVSGGTGTDKARRDTIDVLTSIEGAL